MPPSKEIGIAYVEYNETGGVHSTTFTPASRTLSQEDVSKIQQDLKAPANTPDEAAQIAHAALSEWFIHVENIELADREKSHIHCEILFCDKFSSGKPKRCAFRFTFVHAPQTK